LGRYRLDQIATIHRLLLGHGYAHSFLNTYR